MTTAAPTLHTQRPHETHGSAGRQRRRVIALLHKAAGPIDAKCVADTLDIHVTTARFHLSRLESQGVVRRGPDARHRSAGRPRLTYEIAPRLDYADIVALFAVHLGGSSTEREARAVQIGADLARRVNVPASAGFAVADLVVDSLGQFGFRIESVTDALGTVTVQICSCPLAEIAAHAPEVVRGIQQGFLQEVLDTNSDRLRGRYRVTVHPDPHHGACQVHLVVHPEG